MNKGMILNGRYRVYVGKEINASTDQEAIELFKEIMRLKEDEQEEQ